MLIGKGGRSGASGDAELVVDIAQVLVDRARGEEEALSKKFTRTNNMFMDTTAIRDERNRLSLGRYRALCSGATA